MPQQDIRISYRPYFGALIDALDCGESDQLCFYALSVLLTMTTNPCKSYRLLSSSMHTIAAFFSGRQCDHRIGLLNNQVISEIILDSLSSHDSVF